MIPDPPPVRRPVSHPRRFSFATRLLPRPASPVSPFSHPPFPFPSFPEQIRSTFVRRLYKLRPPPDRRYRAKSTFAAQNRLLPREIDVCRAKSTLAARNRRLPHEIESFRAKSTFAAPDHLDSVVSLIAGISGRRRVARKAVSVFSGGIY